MIIVIVVVSLGFAGYLVFPAMNITAQEQPEVFCNSLWCGSTDNW